MAKCFQTEMQSSDVHRCNEEHSEYVQSNSGTRSHKPHIPPPSSAPRTNSRSISCKPVMLHRTSALARPCARRVAPARLPAVQAMGLFNFGTARGCELAPKEAPPGLKLATFAGGCFWGLELAYQRVPGVVSTAVGYTQGAKPNPTYEEVCSGSTGHTEAVLCTYDEKEVSFEQLLDVFFNKVDPTTLNRQGSDRGTQYRSGVYYHDEAQKEALVKKVAEINEKLASGLWGKVSGQKVVSEVLPAGDFYIAEKYHQQYLSKGGRFGMAQSAAKGCSDPIRCYG